jgi:pyruvate dehydrogenase E1 component
VPNCEAYDPSFGYELAVIIKDGIRRMYLDNEDVFYYITTMNDDYVQLPKPEGDEVEQGILKGLYKIRAAEGADEVHANILSSGAIMNCALEAQQILAEKYGVAADVYSVTNYKKLQEDCLSCERWNMLHPLDEPKVPYLQQVFEGAPDVFVATSDYVKTMSDALSSWLPGELISLGTNGYGRSDSREALREHFEVDARFTVVAVLTGLAREGRVDREVVAQAIKDLGIDPEKPNPMFA